MISNVRPITAWPWPESRYRHRAPFKANWSNTVNLLEREIRMRRASRYTIEIDVNESAIRLDGFLRADARPLSPRIVITFEDPKHGWVRYRCDRYANWQENVRAVALSLEALRKCERYGVATGEQYSGFVSARALGGHVMTTVEAAQYVAEVSDDGFTAKAIVDDNELAASAVRAAFKRAHPDQGGSDDVSLAVKQCRDILEQHHGVL